MPAVALEYVLTRLRVIPKYSKHCQQRPEDCVILRLSQARWRNKDKFSDITASNHASTVTC